MKIFKLIPTIAYGLLLMLPASSYAAVDVDVYGTFHALGITVDIDATDDANENAVALLRYRPSGAGSFEAGMPLTRITSTRFVGSVFGATEGTEYDIQIEFSDDGALNGQVIAQTAQTRDPLVVPTANTSYVVSPTGSGTSCSLASPCSIDQAISAANGAFGS